MLYLIVGLILGAFIYYKIIKPASFWKDKDITYVSSWSVIGNLGKAVFRRKHFNEIVTDLYSKFPNDRYLGYMQFMQPVLLIRDLDLIKQIGVKEFESFHDHLSVINRENNPLLSKSLSLLVGKKWKQMRATLSPVFTGSKMRNMYSLMWECAKNFTGHFRGKERVSIEMKDLASRFANDVIATCAFGIQVDSLKEPNHEFYQMGKVMTTSFTAAILTKDMIFRAISKKLAKLFSSGVFPEHVLNFFKSIILNNIKLREKEGIVRPDLIHLLMEARKGKLKHENTNEIKEESFAAVEESDIGRCNERIELTDDYMVAQALVFFFAGFDAVSTASSFVAHELAVNPDVQKKLQEEIDAVNKQYGNEVPYEALVSMKYLDQVVTETLRLWPPAAQTDRLCNREYIISPKSPKEIALTIEKGVSVIIPIMGIHRDPQYFENPERFDPERFSDENKAKIVPGSYMPFGLGPRNCIGSRFALLEVKILFFHLLLKFDIEPTEKTEIPLKISPKKFQMGPANGFNLALKRRTV